MFVRLFILAPVLGVALCALINVSIAQSQGGRTIEEMRNYCALYESVAKRKLTSSEMLAAGICLGRLQGINAGIIKFSGNIGTICFPKNGTTEQYLEVFLKWSENNPERLQEPWTDGVIASMKDAFPCEPKT